DVVTADGRLRHATAEENPDLFWGLRGGGGNLGIVTAMEAELVPLRQVWGGALFFDGQHAPAVLAAYRQWTAALPDELTSSVALLAYPDLPMLPAALRGRYVASVRLAFTGEPEVGERLLAPLRQVAPTLLDTVHVLPWTESHTITTDPPEPHPYLGTNAVLRDLDPAAAQTILELAGPDAPLPCVVQVNQLGGALGRRSAVSNAVGHRDGRYLLRVLSVVGSSGRRPIAGAHERLLTALQRVTVGRLVGFQFGEHSIEQTRACYDAADYRRLAALKATYDPENRFRCNHNVPPAAS
ncbi:MAG: BBE domain-containing protein, partial [Candidatus Dormiibacterota bacterium]